MTSVTRRGFFGAIAAAAVGLALDPDRLLWVPGQKTIFLPSVRQATSVEMAELLRPGDVFTISGHYARNPLTRQLTEYLQDFVVVSTEGNRVNFASPSLPKVGRKAKAQPVGWPVAWGRVA